MTSTEQPGGAPRVPGYLAYLPAAWICAVILMALRAAVGSWPAINDYEMPQEVVLFLEVAIAIDAVLVLWGLWVLSLAWGRSRRFPAHFTAWQVAQIVWLVLSGAYVQLAPYFVFSPTTLLWTVAQIAIGIFCIVIVRRERQAPALYAAAPDAPVPVFVSILAGLVGVVVGAVVGFGAGLLIGVLISEATDMSCFEGACGFFAFFVGLAGGLVGAIAGGILGVWLTRRRRRAPA